MTGGAGFIGSHLVGGSSSGGRGRRPRQPRGAGPRRATRRSFRTASRHQGDVGDAELVDRALDGVDRVVHLAAAVGVGQSMYEIDRYVGRTRWRRRRSSSDSSRADRSRAPRRGVLDVDLRRGRVRVPDEHGAVAPRPAPGGAARGAALGVHVPDAAASSSRPVGTPETSRSIPTSVYAITKRDHEELCLVVGAAYGIPTVALRFFNVYGPGQALSNPYTGVAAIFASRLLNGRAPVIFEDGLQSRDFIHVDDIVRASCSRSSRTTRSAAPSTSAPAARRPSTTSPRARRRPRRGRRAGAHRAVPRGRHPPLLRGHGASRELLGFRATVSLEDGMKRSRRLARRAGRGGPRRRGDARARERGLAR